MVLAVLLASAGLSACGDDEGDGGGGTSGQAGDGDGDSDGDGDGDGDHGDGGLHGDGDGDGDAGTGDPDVDSAAADLRVTLNLLLSEHVALAGKATGAALGGRDEEYAAYGALLEENGTDVGALVGAAFGDEAETQFNAIWAAHNGYFVDYTLGVAADDEQMKSAAVENLTGSYVPDFAAFLSGATDIPEEDLSSLIAAHVLSTKAIVDAQGEEDWDGVYTATREAFAHMTHLGDPLAAAIAAQLPEEFPGDPDAASVDFRVALNELMQEHVFLATSATGAALGGRTDEFMAAGAALAENGTDVGAAVGTLYGAEAETAFNDIWEAHNGYFVDYTTGVATDDMDAQNMAVENLTTIYVPDFAAFLAGATDLPEDTLTTLTASHVLGTKDVVDAQGAGDAEAAAQADRGAAHHMSAIGDPLAAAIVAKLPEKF